MKTTCINKKIKKCNGKHTRLRFLCTVTVMIGTFVFIILFILRNTNETEIWSSKIGLTDTKIDLHLL